MYRKAIGLLACVVLSVPMFACQGKVRHFDPTLSRQFFPLVPNSVWAYQVKSKSQRSTYVVTDKAIGKQYVPSLNVTGEVVEEYYNMSRGGARPIVYVTKSGYLTRLSGLAYAKEDIEAPAWGRSEEGEFMPANMVPDLEWRSTIFPFGHMAGAFDIKQVHHTYFDPDDVVVPAGHFSGCIRIETAAQYEGGSYSKFHKPLRLTYEDYYAPHVGLVETVTYQGGRGGPEMERVELLRYSPAGKAAAPAASGAHVPVAH